MSSILNQSDGAMPQFRDTQTMSISEKNSFRLLFSSNGLPIRYTSNGALFKLHDVSCEGASLIREDVLHLKADIQ